MKHPLVKRFLPHLIAVLSFLAISAVYFYPAFDGNKLNQSDQTTFRGMAQEIVEYRRMYGEDPLWTNSMFGGMPAYQISVDHSNDIISIIDDVVTLGLPRPANYLFLYLLGFYILMISLRVKPAMAAVGAVAFAFSSYYFIILEAGHNTKAHAIGYMAPILAGIIWAYRGKFLFGGAVAALFLALEIDANHVQITYYLGFLVLFMVLVFAFRAFRQQKINEFIKASVVLLIAAVLGVAANLNNLWPTYEYGEYSIRGATDLTITPDGSSNEANTTEGLDRDYVTQWSYGIKESLTILVPNLMGGESGALIDQNTQKENPQLYREIAQGYQATQVFPNSYWGDQPFTSGPVYFGATVFLLFILGLAFVKNRLKWALLVTVMLTIALAWGKNFMGLTDFFLDFVPGYNKFRAVTIILSIAGLAFPILGFIFLRQLWMKPQMIADKPKLFFGVAGGLALVLLAFVVAPQAFFNFLSTQENEIFSGLSQGDGAAAVLQYVSALQEARADLLVADAMRSLIFVLLTGGVVWLFAKGRVNEKILIVSLAVLIIGDLWPVSKRYVNNEKEKGRYVQWQPAEATAAAAYPVAAADSYILQREVEMNPRVGDAVNSAVTEYRDEAKKDVSRRASQEEIDNVKFAALRFSTDYRVLNLNGPFLESRTSYFHSSIGGYHGAKLKRVQELYDFHIAREIASLGAVLQGAPDMNSVDRAIELMDVTNMLNTKYIVYNPEAPPFENEYAFGPAWFVEYIQVAESADEEILALDELELRSEGVVHSDFNEMVKDFNFQESADAIIAVEAHLPNYISYIYDSPVPQAVVFSEIYYPEGWNAYLDGEKVDYFRANYALRGMLVPDGSHKIEFKFEPKSYAQASTISTGAGLIVFFFFLFALYRHFKAPEKDVYEDLMS
ncbi:hypothetical protein O3Q51_11035 [Cryomorphaceae bacterium 1068]|nr:hypothetical protein [Cryomorphaceae bacterium 1068]